MRKFSLKEAYIKAFPLIDTRFPFIGALPPLIQVECTTECNLSCVMCNHTYLNGERRSLAFERFKEIVDQFPSLMRVWMFGLGENFLNKDFMRMLSYLKTMGAEVYIIDNFTLITKEIALELVRMRIDQIWLSIERASEEAFEDFRKGASFEGLLRNAGNINRAKEEFERELPELNVCATVSNESFSEMPRLIDFAGSIKAREVMFCQEFGYGRRRVQFDRRLFLEKLKEISGTARSHNIRLRTEIKPVPIRACRLPWIPFISVDGAVMPQCRYFRYSAEPIEFGNVFKQNFKDIWNSGEYRGYRSSARKGKANRVCSDPVNCTEGSRYGS